MSCTVMLYICYVVSCFVVPCHQSYVCVTYAHTYHILTICYIIIACQILSHHIVLVSVKKHSVYMSLCPVTQQQELLSSPCFGVFQAATPKGILPLRSVFVHRHRYHIISYIGNPQRLLGGILRGYASRGAGLHFHFRPKKDLAM